MEKSELVVEKKFFVAANWKMQGDKESILEMCELLSSANLNENTEIVIGFPTIYISYARNNLPEHIQLAGQNVYKVSKGAFTGETSPAMLKDNGAEWVIIGHSERRNIFNESDTLIGEKCAHALAAGLKVIACIGETLAAREAKSTYYIMDCQMWKLSKYIKRHYWTNVVLAYEPIWANGTDKIVKADEVQDVHAFLRLWLLENVSEEVSVAMRIIYAGNVNERISKKLVTKQDVDGFLVSDEALKPEFVNIINAKIK